MVYQEVHFVYIVYQEVQFDLLGGCRDRVRMVIDFTTTYAISTYLTVSSNPVNGEVYSIQHHVIKFVSYFRQVVGCFLRVIWFLPPIKPTTTI
jgi:hypothetical protein